MKGCRTIELNNWLNSKLKMKSFETTKYFLFSLFCLILFIGFCCFHWKLCYWQLGPDLDAWQGWDGVAAATASSIAWITIVLLEDFQRLTAHYKSSQQKAKPHKCPNGDDADDDGSDGVGGVPLQWHFNRKCSTFNDLLCFWPKQKTKQCPQNLNIFY